MSTATLPGLELQEVRRSWLTYLLLGIVLLILGVVALGHSYLTAKVSIVFLGWLLVFAGLGEVVHAFWKERGWSGFFLDLLSGLLHAVVGFLLLVNPGAGVLALTLVIAMFLMIEGIGRIVAALMVSMPHRGWVFVGGVIDLLLGLMILRQWPLSGLWVIGLFIGIQLIFNGWSLIMLSMAAKRRSQPAT